MHKKLKICFVTEDFYPNFIGGQGVYGYQLTTELAKNHHITVIAERRTGRKRYWGKVRPNIKIFLVPFCFGNQLALAILEYLLFKIKLRNKSFDILHANQLSGLLFTFAKPKNVEKVVVTVHNTNSDMAKNTSSAFKKLLYQPLIFLEKIVYKKADALIFNTKYEKEEFLRKKSKVIALGTPKVKFTEKEQQKASSEVRQKLGIPVDSKIILYVGRLVERKRVDSILEASKRLSQKDQKIFTVIIGKGPETQNLKRILAGNSRFLGFVQNTRPFFLAANVFVTVSEAEGGIALAPLEAASYGLPLILSQSAGAAIVKEGENGYLVNPNNTHLLTKKIQQVLDSSSTMGKESRKIASKHTWQKCAKDTFKFYQSIL